LIINSILKDEDEKKKEEAKFESKRKISPQKF